MSLIDEIHGVANNSKRKFKQVSPCIVYCSFDLHKAYISQQPYYLGSFRKRLSSVTIFQNVNDSKGACATKITDENVLQVFIQLKKWTPLVTFWCPFMLSLRLDHTEMSTSSLKKKPFLKTNILQVYMHQKQNLFHHRHSKLRIRVIDQISSEKWLPSET